MATSIMMRHFNSDEWEQDGTKAKTQEELQEIAGEIKANCTLENVLDNGFGLCSVYKNEALGVKYWIHHRYGHVSEIIEATDLN